MPSLTEKEFQKMNLDQSFKEYRRHNLKLIYKIKLDNEEKYSKREVITKILKLDENNQCGFAMMKPMQTWLKFNLLLETVDLDNPIKHLFVVKIFLMKKMLPKSTTFTMKFFCLSLKNCRCK